ncbi:MarR family winged helix-turn-helix transcriptional regulator [Nocardia mangyaensis]|uniref:MarR family winged helix-turn-helix transcriptional regulator n=1 Tax=Nocardia mangyaensis TaxID=2213200 RepID=UPI002676CD7E|nr:MarR family transcriptional regulator [Nocardia mangyaensis]MDO3646169.1 MarR family transcriptional regulator [Nocardia mangyaensis]
MPDNESDLVMQVARTLRRRWAAAYAPLGLTPHQARALRVTGEHDGLRLSAVADALRISARSATEVVDALEKAKLVTRKPDPTDRRAILVAVTALGERTLGTLAAARTKEADEFFAHLTAAERAALRDILGKLVP